MRVKLQLVMCDDDGQAITVTDVVTLKKDTTRLEHLGLTLTEAKQLLKTIQQRLLQRQLEQAFWLRADVGVEEFHTYIANNRHLIPNYGERYRNGEAIATGFVVSTVNQVVSKRFCKRQQMQWSKRGAHLLLQTRVKTLNHELGAVFKRWCPDLEVEERAEAA